MPASGFVPPTDAFGRTAVLRFAASFPVLGVRLRVRSNAEAAIALADASFGAWRALPRAVIRRTRPAHLDIVVHPPTRDALPQRLCYRRHGPALVAGGGPVLATVLLRQRHAVVFVPAQALSAPDWWSAHVNSHGLFAASLHQRVPLHAAAVVRDGRALLLAGPSGAGKSTMAWACHAAGFGVLAEDTVFVDLATTAPRLWSHAPRIWLAPDTVRFFPSLAGRPLVQRSNGKRRLEVRCRADGEDPLLTFTGAVAVVLLHRGTGRPTLAAIPGAEAAGVLDNDDTEGFNQYPDSRPPVSAWLRRTPAFRLDTGADPVAAADRLRRLARRPWPGTT